jgi:arabinose-5-phosphate isomerase
MSHGDLGIIAKKDALIVISNSGNSSELFNLLDYAKRNSICVIGISSNRKSELIKSSTIPLVLPNTKEACSIGMAPTTSTSMTLVLGDALCVSLMKLKKFNISKYRSIHPGGQLGINLLQVKDVMHIGKKIPLVSEIAKMKAVIIEMTKKSFGHVGVVNKVGDLSGIITDGDLRRNLEPEFLNKSAKTIMTKKPKLILQNALMVEALKIMNNNKITCLFIKKNKMQKNPIGIIHIHDCIRFLG